MNTKINQLIEYGLEKGLLKNEDVDYAVNLLLDLFHLDSFEYEELHEYVDCTQILDGMLDYAIEQGLIEDHMTARDLFDTRIMNCLMPRPSEVVEEFNKFYEVSAKFATDYFYKLSIASQYIRKNRTDKNIQFKKYYQYGNIEITINLSKPEKDPKEIAKAKLVKSSGYPKCLLCKENVGFAGDFQRNARQTHRIIPLDLDGQRYYLQYSPYVYYNEHCIVFNEEHKPMVINHDTFEHLLTFVEKFPHYMLGSNADLPIVGGSILTHDHFQGGNYTFPIEGAKVIKSFTLEAYPGLKIEILKWPLSTVRVSSPDRKVVIQFADDLLKAWRNYNNMPLDILSHTEDILHNTITPIARMNNNNYQMDLVLRNNRTNDEYPDGIFHPHQDLHHIKKENIGLIEVMGLAILPARLKTEFAHLKECLLGKADVNDYDDLTKHHTWYEYLRQEYTFDEENVEEILREELTKKFVRVLEDAGVFKMNDEGIDAFVTFVESLG